MSYNKLLIQSILPLIYLNVIVSEGQIKIGDFYVGLIFYWLLIIVSFLAYCLYFPSKISQVKLAAAIVFFWLLDEIFPSKITFVLHIASVNYLFFAMGIITLVKFPKVIVRQLMVFLLLNLPIMIIQIMGISEIVHIFNTLMWKYEPGGSIIKEVNIDPALLVGPDNIIYNSAQGRPSGLLHSNAALGPVTLYIAAFIFGNTYREKVKFLDLLVVVSVVMVMAKIVVITFFLMLFIMYKISVGTQRRKYVKTLFAASISFYFLYYIFFPGLFINNLSLDAFIGSSLLRLIDTAIYFIGNTEQQQQLVELLSSDYSFNYIDDTDIGALSGFTTIIKILPLIILMLYLFRKRIRLITQKIKTAYLIYPNISKLVSLAILMTSFATALFKAPIFAYFLGIAILPYICMLNREYKNILNN